MFFTSLAGVFHVGKKAAEESSQKTKLEKDCFLASLSFFRLKFFEPLQIFVKDEPARSGGTT